jgi:outer membrane murein-binding lipoprotein Lpp
MGKKKKALEERQLIKIEEMGLEEIQLAEQLYNSAGLDPVVDAGLKDYDERLQQEDKLISKVFGPRGSDIKGYGQAVAKRVAFAVYALLNKQYGGKVGDLRSYIMTLQDERDRANARYDELMGRVVGILGEEYKELRTDSKVFMEKLTTILGEDIKESRIDHKALAERLADIDGLRSQIAALSKEKNELKETYESQITALKDEHNEEVKNLGTQIAELDSRIEGLESEETALTNDLEQLTEGHNRLKTAVITLAGVVPHEEIGKRLGEELYAFLLKDSKVPHMVINGVGKFIDFRKYLGLAAVKGAEEATKQAEETLRSALSE